MQELLNDINESSDWTSMLKAKAIKEFDLDYLHKYIRKVTSHEYERYGKKLSIPWLFNPEVYFCGDDLMVKFKDFDTFDYRFENMNARGVVASLKTILFGEGVKGVKRCRCKKCGSRAKPVKVIRYACSACEGV